MRHRISGRKLNRTSSHRRALFANMAKSLIQHEQIKTTLPRAKELRPFIEKLVTGARGGSLASRRRAFAVLRDNALVAKLFSSLADRYRDRPGGYTRILKAGWRYGDDAPMGVIEFVDRDVDAKGAEDLARHRAEQAARSESEPPKSVEA